ncbi:uncharacterized protein E0L32_005261 [Thyridium curvatum]|uniref:Uncharacterized protein n=1 Tax=Thyridium curvatum TaxID=1093900 RepID=A0A507BB21_9PEZI|nr:uncharacterized protein E0L32_005261 [Thyridium curvatum]TPX14569.1 hypothetical protein E0L32_005261 [Thyridium curvatum]
MSTLFCCGEIRPYRPQYLQHEAKFTRFMAWAAYPKDVTSEKAEVNLAELNPSFAVQLVRQVNYGALESKRYFIPHDDGFMEISENDLIQANFQKLNSYKNFKCEGHNKFFEVNIYQKDPVNQHHWRANLARPASTIDL